ncbi:hypothetical protein COT72_00405 [archaeon CG10_big_fil_rev_8_21_14_0_10_43_11]|nr:MAG: hypothetical protein COT72_00405 [archaeon CG10_big_fil_rev_8_21_14_0_10_43_11]
MIPVGVPVKVFITCLLLFSVFSSFVGTNDEARVNLARAIVEEHSFITDSFANNSIDRAYYKGHYYTEKVPLTSFVLVPVYTIWKAVFGLLPVHTSLEEELISSEQLFYFFATFVVSAIPSALLCTLVYYFLRKKTKQSHAILGALAIAFATMLFTYSRTLFGSALGALLSFSAYYLISEHEDKQFLAGMLGALAIVADLLSGIVLVVIFVQVLYRRKNIVHFLAGCFAGILPLLVYNIIIFGTPFDILNAYADPLYWPGEPGLSKEFSFSISGSFNTAVRSLFYPYRGLFFYSPVLLFGLFAVPKMLRKEKAHALAFLGVFVLLVLLLTQLKTWWGGLVFELRHFTVLIPFFALPLVRGFEGNKKPLFFSLLLISLFFHGLGLTYPEEVELVNQEMAPSSQARFDTFLPIANPLFSYYAPRIFLEGTNSFLNLLFPTFFVPLLVFIALVLLVVWATEIEALVRRVWSDTWLLKTIGMFFAVTLLGIFFVVFIHQGLVRLSFPFDFTTAEGFVFAFSKNLSLGSTLYPPLPAEGMPSINTYPPFFYALSALLMPLFSQAFVAGRIISFIASLGIGVLIYVIARKHHAKPVWAALFSFLFFASYFVMFWSAHNRVDMLALFFSVLGLFFISYKKDALGAFAFLFSLYTKHTFIAAPLAVFVYLFLYERRRARVFFTMLFGLGLALFVALTLLSNGEFVKHVFLYTSFGSSFDIYLFVSLVLSAPLLLFLTYQYVRSSPHSLLGMYALFAFALLVFQAFNAGSSSNYALESLFISCIIGAVYLSAHIKTERMKALLLFGIAAQVLLLSMGGAVSLNPLDGMRAAYSFFDAYPAFARLSVLVNQSTGPVLSEVGGVLFLAHSSGALDVWKLRTLVENGVLSQEELFLRCVEQKYSLIIHTDDLKYVPGLSRCINATYIRIIAVPVLTYPPSRFQTRAHNQKLVEVYART